jgi:hypothetical protein
VVDPEDDDEGEEWFESDMDGNVKIHRDINPGSIGLDDSVPCEATKSDTGNRKFKALFGGSRTHNEQILVRPCGVIVSRATFYNAEAVSNVLVRILYQFPSASPYLLSPAVCTEDILCTACLQA